MRASVLSRHGEGVLANSRNGLLVVDPRDFCISRSLLRNGSYDWPRIEWLGRILDARSQLVFVGAHIGALLVPIAQRSGARDIVAFEPSPTNFRLLKMNLALNGLGNVVIHQLAAGDSDGTVLFAPNRSNSGNSRICPSGEETIQVSRLDGVLLPNPQITLLVMDTEGFEVRAMRGALASLAKTRYFYVEYAPEQLREQGAKTGEFIELAASRFESLYVPGNPVQFLPARSFVSYLEQLRPRRGLLLNLLFSNDSTPRPELMQAVAARPV